VGVTVAVAVEVEVVDNDVVVNDVDDMVHGLRTLDLGLWSFDFGH
jgi:hypothetical protein